MRPLVTLFILSCLPGMASAQDGLLWTSDLNLRMQGDDDNAQINFTAFGRYSVSGGDAIKGTFGYNQIFKPGFGGGVEVGCIWGVHDRYGFYAAAEVDLFDGDKKTDTVGDTIEPDAMTVAALLVGVKADGTLTDWLSWEGRVAFGAAYIPDVDADVTVTGVTSSVNLFSQSAAFVVEGAVRLTWGNLSLGGGARYMGPPKEGSDFTSAEKPDAMIIYFGEVGFSFTF